MTSPDWVTCLEDFRTHLQQQRRAVVEGRADEVHEFVPAAGLGPLPGALAGRARELQTESDALCALLEEQLRHTADALTQLNRPSQPPRASFVDSRC